MVSTASSCLLPCPKHLFAAAQFITFFVYLLWICRTNSLNFNLIALASADA
jgi:hypothetical protein